MARARRYVITRTIHKITRPLRIRYGKLFLRSGTLIMTHDEISGKLHESKFWFLVNLISSVAPGILCWLSRFVDEDCTSAFGLMLCFLICLLYCIKNRDCIVLRVVYAEMSQR